LSTASGVKKERINLGEKYEGPRRDQAIYNKEWDPSRDQAKRG